MDDPVLIMIPIYNDWRAVGLLLKKLDGVLHQHEVRVCVLLIDDGSVSPIHEAHLDLEFSAIQRVEVLALRRNLGHQRAIAIGLAYVEQHIKCRALLIMDGDGEDAPEDVPRLLDRLRDEGESCIIFAERTRRAESWLFSTFYHLYRFLHLLLTGIPVRVGNFSVMPAALLRQIVVVFEVWNHYAAAVFKSRLPYKTIPTRRAVRLDGHSQMNFVSLVVHGLDAISVHGEVVGTRMLLGVAMLAGLTAFLLVVIVLIRLVTDWAIPGWTSTIVGLLLIILLQGLALSIVLVFIILSSRSHAVFLPLRDYQYFVDAHTQLYPSPMARSGVSPAHGPVA